MNLAYRTVGNRLVSKAEYDRYFRAGAETAATLYGNEKAQAICAREGIVIRAQGESTNPAGGFLFSDGLEGSIDSYRSVSGTFRNGATVKPMNSDVRSFPRRVSGQAASFVGENQAGVESDAAFDQVSIRAKKAMALTRASSEVLEDSLADLGAWIIEELGFAFADLEDSCGWNGDASPAFGRMVGITKLLQDGAHAGAVTAGAGHDTFQELDAADIGALIGALPEQYLPNAKLYCSSYGIGNALVRLGASAYGVTDTPTGSRPLLHFAGYPVVATPKLPGAGSQTGRAMVAFGDLRAASILGERRGITVKASGGRLLEKDQIMFRATERFEINNHNLGDSTKVGAIVGLLGA